MHRDGNEVIDSSFVSDFMELDKDICVGLEKREKDEGVYLPNFDRANNSKIQKAAEKIGSRIPRKIAGASAVFKHGDPAYANLRKDLEDVFEELSSNSKHPNWHKGVGSAEYNAFIEVSALNALVIAESDDIEETRHYPSTDSLESVEGEPSSYWELATGGVIVHCSEDTEVDDEKLRVLLNLRNRASSIEQHKRRATIKEREQARRSAVSTVMSRNMSHNVGSHVLANLSNSDDLEESLGRSSGSWGGPVAEFNDYLRTRMDFIADVSTSSPAASTPIALYQDVFYPFAHKEEGKKSSSRRAGQHLLLEHISGIEDLGVENLNLRANVDGEDATEDDAKDVPFSSPNGLLGAHALYVIVENIIRNSAKHAYDSSEQDGFDLTIDVNEAERYPGLAEVSVYDSLGNGGKTLKDGTPLPESLNDLIEEDIIEDDGSLNYDGWGVREMKICAAYLRGIAPQNLDKGFDPSLLEARAFARFTPPVVENEASDENCWASKARHFAQSEEHTLSPFPDYGPSFTDELSNAGKKDLGYTFYLQRPKEVFILDPSGALDATVEEEELTRAGIMHATDEKNVEAAFNEGVEHHILVVVDAGEDLRKRVEEKHANALPIRVLWCDSGDGLHGDLSQFLAPERKRKNATSGTLEGNAANGDGFEAKRLIRRVWGAWHREQGYVDQLLLRTPDEGIIDSWDGAHRVTATSAAGNEQIEQARNSVVYDRHGLLLFVGEGIDREVENLRYEAVEGASSAYHLIHNPPKGKPEREKLALELIEASECGVMLLDERIQSLLEGKEETFSLNEEDGLSFPVSGMSENHPLNEKSILEWISVWVPKKATADLDHPKQNEDALYEWFRKRLKNTDFLVVHLGVLEKLYEEDEGDLESGRLLEDCKNEGVDVIVTSGRGRPPQVVDMEVRFLHYSQVAEHITKERSKYHFCRALFSARRLRYE